MKKPSALVTMIVVLLLVSFRPRYNEGHPHSTAKSFRIKYYWIDYSYNGTWRDSKTNSQRVLFISKVGSYDCDNYKDCDNLYKGAIEAFKSRLSIYETSSTGASMNSRDSQDEVSYGYNTIKSYCKKNGYVVVEVD